MKYNRRENSKYAKYKERLEKKMLTSHSEKSVLAHSSTVNKLIIEKHKSNLEDNPKNIGHFFLLGKKMHRISVSAFVKYGRKRIISY